MSFVSMVFVCTSFINVNERASHWQYYNDFDSFMTLTFTNYHYYYYFFFNFHFSHVGKLHLFSSSLVTLGWGHPQAIYNFYT